MADESLLSRIEKLVDEEHRLYRKTTLTDADQRRLNGLQVELDQCWDLLRQRRALRDAGMDPDQAEVRPAEVIENYKQ